MVNIRIKRIYETYAKTDGTRILVDRLWPRGIKKEEAHIDQWFKEVAPSNELRKWYNHEPEKHESFRAKYQSELSHSAALDKLLDYIDQHELVTLLFAAKDEELSNASVLKEIISNHLKQ
jgi:uncharacterized protein YeaO (DUF488 family)